MAMTAFRVPRPVALLAGGHFCVDIYSSMLAAFLPFLTHKLGLSLSAAGFLAGALVFSSSLSQPLYGLLADRIRHKALVALGPAIAGIFISCLGLAPNFTVLLLLLLLGGVGMAAFHPQAAALVHDTSSDNHAFNMSIFVTAGTVGFALGPVYISLVIGTFGLSSSWWAAVPGILVSILLFLYGPSPVRHHAQPRERLSDQLRGFVKPLVLLYLLVVIRSIVFSGISSFLPLYYTGQGYAPARASQFLTAFLFAGGAAGLAGGLLAGRFGGRRITAFSFISSLPLLFAFPLTQGGLSVLIGSIASALLLFTGPVNIVMAQKLVPRGASTVAALMMGFAWGTAGLFVPVVGMLNQNLGFQYTFWILAILTLPGFVLTLILPPDQLREAQPGAVRTMERVTK
jgi:MFS transporter, FSR family, fosmidomycin resistance protein